jgi:hypothetical protein
MVYIYSSVGIAWQVKKYKKRFNAFSRRSVGTALFFRNTPEVTWSIVNQKRGTLAMMFSGLLGLPMKNAPEELNAFHF